MDRRADMTNEIGSVRCFANVQAALKGPNPPNGVVIASPPAFHVEQAIAALKSQIPVLLEKPVSTNLKEAQELVKVCESTTTQLLLGYTWRWWPPILEAKKNLEKGAIGSIRHVRFTMSAHLEDWHPWEPYTDFFMSSEKLGGGALLDESHWIDLALWFFGLPKSIIASIGKISDLEIETDDNVDILLNFEAGLRATIHLDLFGRPHEKSIRFVGEQGSCLWTESPNRLAFSNKENEKWDEKYFCCERNDMFLGVAEEFLRVIDGASVPTCTLQDGVQVLEVIEAARRSQSEGQKVSLFD